MTNQSKLIDVIEIDHNYDYSNYLNPANEAENDYSITERIDAITEIEDKYRSVTPPIPKSVKIELTARCDFSCFFCAVKKRLRKKSDIKWEFYKRIVKEMRDAGVEELGLFYLGESFLYPKLDEAVRFAKEECGYPYVFLTTNGRMATPDRVEKCMAAGLDSLKFSFNNADADQFHEITKVKKEDFYKVIENIKAARVVRDQGAYQCGIYASSIHYNGDQLTRMEKSVEEILPFVDEHYWLPLYGQAGLTSGDNNTAPVAGNPGRLDAMRAPLPCWAAFTEGHITYDGYLSACCFDHDGRFHMGDLNTENFKDAWHSKAFQSLRQANLNKQVVGTPCEKCIAYE